MCIYKQGLAGWALPVEPVVCVAWKWERVIATEVVAGIGILKGPNGCINKNNNIEVENKRIEGRKDHFIVNCWPVMTACSVICQKDIYAV